MKTSFSPRTAFARFRASTRTTPSCCRWTRTEYRVDYEPAESSTGLFGGNSNWRGPVWFPVNYLIIESLQKFHHYFGDDYKVECPTGSGNADALGSGGRNFAAVDAHVPAGCRRQAAGPRRQPRYQTIRTGGTWCCSTNTSTATTARDRREPSDRLDGARVEAAAAERRVMGNPYRAQERSDPDGGTQGRKEKDGLD